MLRSSIIRYSLKKLLLPGDSKFISRFKYYYRSSKNSQILNYHYRGITKSAFHYKKKNFKDSDDQYIIDSEEDQNFLDHDKNYHSLLHEIGGNLSGLSSMAVLQPWIKWGPNKNKTTNADLLLNEACALIKSLPSITITHKESISCESISKTSVFGSGTLERLKREIGLSGAQGIFVSVDHLNKAQKRELESYFGLKVFDRFFIVLAIFKHHATSLEAKLQIALAELPFMSKRLLSDSDRVILDERNARLKNAVRRVAAQRERARTARRRASIPSVAVVGYTNCGKTTLIRALSGDKRLMGEDRLFATLDVTAHRGALPCGLKVIFLDTVGFIQNIPTSLIAAFQATLQDAAHADAVLVVRDPGHPDAFGQAITVSNTLRDLSLPADTPIVTVSNKIDLLGDHERSRLVPADNEIFASSLTGEGLNEVLLSLQKEVLRVTGRKTYRMKFATGSPKIEWLKSNVGVASESFDAANPQETTLLVVANEAELAAFRKAFR